MNAKTRQAISRALKRSWRGKQRKKRLAHRAEITAVPPTDELGDLRVKVERALELIHEGMAQVNEGWDLINSIPKRVS